MGDQKLSLSYKSKLVVFKTSLIAFGVTFEMASKGDKELQREISVWPEGWRFSLGILPNGPEMTMQKQLNHMVYLGLGPKNPDLSIWFKNLDAALMVFTGQIGSAQAFAEHRAILHGNVNDAVRVSRGMQYVQAYLLPGIMNNKNFKRPMKLSFSQLLLKGKIMAMLGPGLVLNMNR